MRTWYWLAVLSRRYSSAAQSYVLEDAQALEKAAQGDFSLVASWLAKVHPVIREWDDLLTIHKKYDALYKGILNLVNYQTGGFASLQSGEPVSWQSTLEDHHIFPKDYIRNVVEKGSQDAVTMTDSVVNRTLIPKLTNLRASNKAPSVYLQEIGAKNASIGKALDTHMIPRDLITGGYDDLYPLFLEDRAKAIMDAMQRTVLAVRSELLNELGVQQGD